MIIPLGTDRPSKRQALVTPVLIGINLGVFVMMAFLARFNPDIEAQIGFYGAISRHHFHFWQPISSAFLHAGYMHIFGNMLFLLAFGPSVEDRLGRFWFLIFYLAAGAASGFAHIALEDAPAVGASGAIAGVSGAFLVLFPKTKIKCFVIFFIIGIFMVPSWWLIGMFIVLDLGAQLINPNNGIANLAHLGGYGFGAILSLLLLVTKILPREQYDMFSLAKHRKRRAEFRVAHEMHKLAGVYQVDQNLDPESAQIAELRAEIGALITKGELQSASQKYLKLIEAYPDDEKTLTLHRDAQYQIANQLYQSNLKQAAFDAFERLLAAYPNDPERHIITILLARMEAYDLNDPVSAIQKLEELSSKAHDQETDALIKQELESIRALNTTIDSEPENQ